MDKHDYLEPLEGPDITVSASSSVPYAEELEAVYQESVAARNARVEIRRALLDRGYRCEIADGEEVFYTKADGVLSVWSSRPSSDHRGQAVIRARRLGISPHSYICPRCQSRVDDYGGKVSYVCGSCGEVTRNELSDSSQAKESEQQLENLVRQIALPIVDNDCKLLNVFEHLLVYGQDADFVPSEETIADEPTYNCLPEEQEPIVVRQLTSVHSEITSKDVRIACPACGVRITVPFDTLVIQHGQTLHRYEGQCQSCRVSVRALTDEQMSSVVGVSGVSKKTDTKPHHKSS